MINFDPPEDDKGYVHRVGRTGRAGRSGNGITFVLPEQQADVSRVASRLGHREQFEARGCGSAPRRAASTRAAAAATHAGKRFVEVARVPVRSRYASNQSSPARIGTRSPRASMPCTSTSGPPIGKSVCASDWLSPSSTCAARVERARAGDRLDVAHAVGDVGRRVLVEERVVEEQAALADARARDERTLAEVARVLVRSRCLRRNSSPTSARASTILPGFEAQLDPVDEDALVVGDRPRAAHGALGPEPVGRRVDLLGRHVRAEDLPPRRARVAAEPARLLHQPDRQVGAGAAEVDPVEAPLVEHDPPLLERVEVLLPRHDGVGVVQPARVRDLLEQAVDVGLAEHALGPRRVGVRDHDPRGELLVHRPVEQLADQPGLRARQPLLVGVLEVRRRRVARDVDRRGLRVELELDEADTARVRPGRGAPRRRASRSR